MRISDWSSDVCSSDLAEAPPLSSSARGNRAAPIDRSQVGDSRRTRALPRYLAFRTKRHAVRLEHRHRRRSRGARSRIHAETGAAHFQRSLAAHVDLNTTLVAEEDVGRIRQRHDIADVL